MFEKTVTHLLAEFDQLGEIGVRAKTNQMPGYSHNERVFAEAWLHQKESDRRDAREAAISAKAEEANELAREANSIARLEAAAASRSARYAMYAAAIAAIGAITANKEEILRLIF